MSSKLMQLVALGQSPWLDYISYDLLRNGELEQLITNDGLGGITSNPAIFEKAIAGTNDYDDKIIDLSKQELGANEIYEQLAISEVQVAADIFYPVYIATNGLNGYVSIEVNPYLAGNAEKTVQDALRLWQCINRPNIFIKIPATDEGIIAIEHLTSLGINVNVTLIFGIERYRQTIEAYIIGLETRKKNGLPLTGISSVASFFLSRIDTMIDPLLAAKNDVADWDIANKMIGQTACACAKIAYQVYLEAFGNERFNRLSCFGAATQRLLWASTGTKNPDFSDVKYIDSLIARETVSTMPPETLNAFRDHGTPRITIIDDIASAGNIMEQLKIINIDLKQIVNQLEAEGIQKFKTPFDAIIAAILRKMLK